MTGTLRSFRSAFTAARIRRGYLRKVALFMLIGALLVAYCDLTKYGISGYPLSDAGVLALMDLLAWTFVGLAVAWLFKSLPGEDLALNR